MNDRQLIMRQQLRQIGVAFGAATFAAMFMLYVYAWVNPQLITWERMIVRWVLTAITWYLVTVLWQIGRCYVNSDQRQDHIQEETISKE